MTTMDAATAFPRRGTGGHPHSAGLRLAALLSLLGAPATGGLPSTLGAQQAVPDAVWSLASRGTTVRPVPPALQSLSDLKEEIGRLAEGAKGRVGVGVVHLETGREVYLHGDESFPMASTYKVPIAVQFLTRRDRGEVSMDDMITLEPGDVHPGSGMISQLLDDPGVILSIRNVMELMLLISDNSATDLMIEAAGGAAAVTDRMQALGFDGIRVDRPTVELIADWLGIKGLPPSNQVTEERFQELSKAVPDNLRKEAAAEFARDPRDTATPRDMAALLAAIYRHQALSVESSEILLDIMHRCRTGENRLKGILPPGTPVAHKTGTIGQTTNDVGIITLPGGAGHVVVAVFVKDSDVEVPARERVIAQIARTVYDYFLFNPTA